MNKKTTHIIQRKIRIKSHNHQHDYTEPILRLKIIYQFYFLYFLMIIKLPFKAEKITLLKDNRIEVMYQNIPLQFSLIKTKGIGLY